LSPWPPSARHTGDAFFERSEQFLEFDRLQDIRAEADFAEFFEEDLFIVSGEYDEPCVGFNRFDLFGHFDAVFHGHIDIGDDDIRRVLPEKFQPYAAILGGVNDSIREFHPEHKAESIEG